MKKIAIEDIATVFASEFIKDNRGLFGKGNAPFLKMSYSRRKKIVEKTVDKLWIGRVKA